MNTDVIIIEKYVLWMGNGYIIELEKIPCSTTISFPAISCLQSIPTKSMTSFSLSFFTLPCFPLRNCDVLKSVWKMWNSICYLFSFVWHPETCFLTIAYNFLRFKSHEIKVCYVSFFFSLVNIKLILFLCHCSASFIPTTFLDTYPW